jgi:hypothetical protein
MQRADSGLSIGADLDSKIAASSGLENDAVLDYGTVV